MSTIGKYEITRKIGKGASCKVYQGKDTQNGNKVAIKIMSEQIGDEAKRLMVTEVKTMKALWDEAKPTDLGVNNVVK